MNQTQFEKAAGISAGLAVRWFHCIDAAMKEFGITAPLDQAMFIAQMGHESGGFTRLVENLNYAAENLVPTFGKHRITAQQAAALGRTATQPANQKAIANLVYGGEWGKEHLGNQVAG
ncbi:glycoside hydrolase family 19 protein, partial [Enterobacter hormaechei subsp. xiangfangensis]